MPQLPTPCTRSSRLVHRQPRSGATGGFRAACSRAAAMSRVSRPILAAWTKKVQHGEVVQSRGAKAEGPPATAAQPPTTFVGPLHDWHDCYMMGFVVLLRKIICTNHDNDASAQHQAERSICQPGDLPCVAGTAGGAAEGLPTSRVPYHGSGTFNPMQFCGLIILCRSVSAILLPSPNTNLVSVAVAHRHKRQPCCCHTASHSLPFPQKRNQIDHLLVACSPWPSRLV